MFKLNVFLIRFLPCLYTANIWLNLVTSKAFRSSRSQMFYKKGFLKIQQNSQENTYAVVLHTCFPMIFFKKKFSKILKNTYFLITPQNKTTLLRKQISKSNITEIVKSQFIGILQNIFRSWAIIFSQSPKVIFWTNCVFPLKIYFVNFQQVFI